MKKDSVQKDNPKRAGLNRAGLRKVSLKKWFRRVGLAGVLFFLIKGLVWLAILFGAGSILSSC